MSLCYMFQKGRVILAAGRRVPERAEVPEALASRFVNSGLVDIRHASFRAIIIQSTVAACQYRTRQSRASTAHSIYSPTT